MEEKRRSGIGLSGTMIRLKAKVFARDMNLEDFLGTTSWLSCFMKRKNFVMRQKTRISQRLPEEFEEKILQFQRTIIRMRQRAHYNLQLIGNMDETPLNFDMPPNRTVHAAGDKTVVIKTSGNEKNHFTVVLGCMADGTKLMPMIIFKRKRMPKEPIPAGVLVHVHEKGWMDEAGMKLWVRKIWGHRPGGLMKKKSLLVLDTFKAHATESVKDRLAGENSDFVFIPGGLTNQLQPLDVSINKPFKDKVRTAWTEWMTTSDVHEYTKSGRLKKPSIILWCQWIKEKWDKIDPAIIIKAFKKCSISNALDGSEDDLIYRTSDDSESDEDPFSDDGDDDPYDEEP